MAFITCRDIALGYEGRTVAEDIAFEVNPGDYLCVVGENGTGKTTLMKTLLGLLPPAGGQIVTGDGLRKNEIGYLPQQTEIQRDFPASVWEIVLSGCLSRCGMRPFYNRGEKDLAEANIEKLGIADLAKQSYREISGGQQQRVLLARALCATRQLLLLDEPAAGLDPKASADMYRIIESLNTEDGITIIMISHDIASAVKYASHILHIGQHRPLFYGATGDYMQTELGKAFGFADDGDVK